jgi:hypothetical protein
MDVAYNAADTTYRKLIGNQVGHVGNIGNGGYVMLRTGGSR